MSEVKISDFLREVGVKVEGLKEAKKLYERQLAPDFYMFDLLRVKELELSKCIGSLLDPNGKHGQGDVFLEQFIKKLNDIQNEQLDQDEEVGSNSPGSVMPLEWSELKHGCNIQIEQGIKVDKKNDKEQITIKNRRIDIVLAFKNGVNIGIENKPFAEDQNDQLKDYAKDLEARASGKAWRLIYLSNSEPSESSISTQDLNKYLGRVFIVNFDELADWLDVCETLAKAPIVRTFIGELAKYVRKNINREAEMSIRSEVKNIILKEGNFESAMLVAKSINDAKTALINELMIKLESVAQKEQYKITFNEKMKSKGKWKAHTGFGVNLDAQGRHDFEVWFEFFAPNLNALSWGVRRKDKTVIKDERWDEINQLMIKNGSGNASHWWPWWIAFDEKYRDWEVDSSPWSAVQEDRGGDFVKSVMQCVHSVHENLKSSNQLDLFEAKQ